MRLLVLAWGALLALTLVAPVSGLAQDATPTAETAGSATAGTDVRYLLPFTPDGLNPGLTAVTEEAGVCGFPSAAALDRPDAWDCIGAAGQIYDPCFENPFLPPDAPGQLACVDSPFSTDVVVLTLTDPLVRQKEAIATGMSLAQAAGVSIEPGTCPGRWSWPTGTSAPCWAGPSPKWRDRRSTMAAALGVPFSAKPIAASRSGP